MKKSVLIVCILVVVAVASGILYWYWQNIQDERAVAACLVTKTDEECFADYIQEGINHYAKEEYALSIPAFQKAQAAYGSDKISAFDAFRNEANARFELKQYAQAERMFLDLLTIQNHPSQYHLYLDLIKLYDTQHLLDKGIAMADEAYSITEQTQFLYAKASLLQQQEKYNEVIVIYEKLLELEPENKDAITFKLDRLRRYNTSTP